MMTFSDWRDAQPEWVLEMLSDQMYDSYNAGWSEGFVAGKAEGSDSTVAYAEGYDDGYQDAADIYSQEDW